MAIYIPSAMIGELRGSIGSTCFARNSFSTYARIKAVPTNPNTILQRARRNAFTILTAQWNGTLTSTQRLGWNAFASQVNWQNPLGQSIRITGFNHFLRLNTLKILGGLTVQLAAPVVNQMPPPPSIPSFGCSGTGFNLSVTFTAGEAWLTEVGAKLLIFTSPPYAGGKTFLPKQFRYAGAIAGAATPPTSPQVISTLGFVYAPGQKCLMYARLVRLALGVSEPIYAECLWV